MGKKNGHDKNEQFTHLKPIDRRLPCATFSETLVLLLLLLFYIICRTNIEAEPKNLVGDLWDPEPMRRN